MVYLSMRIIVAEKAWVTINGEVMDFKQDWDVEVDDDGNKCIHLDELVKAESSNVDKVGYLKNSKEAFVVFKNGGIYKYKEVDGEDYNALRDAESVGRHLRGVFLKKGFECEKLEKVKLFDLKETLDGIVDVCKNEL